MALSLLLLSPSSVLVFASSSSVLLSVQEPAVHLAQNSNCNATMATTTVEPSVSVTTPSLRESELKPLPNQYELQQYPAVPDIPGEPCSKKMSIFLCIRHGLPILLVIHSLDPPEY